MTSPVFVVGCDRSGTSLLTAILNQSPDLKIIFEAGFLPKLRKNAGEYGDFSQARQRWYFIRDLQRVKATSRTRAFEKFENLTDREAEAAVRKESPTDYVGAASAVYSESARKEEKNRWGEKMPEYVLEVEWLMSAFPGCDILHIIRDPRDVASSIRRAGWKQSLSSAAEYWKERVSSGLAAGEKAKGEQYHEVRYEELVKKPVKEVERICEKVGISLDCNKIGFDTREEILPKRHSEAHGELFSLLGKPIDQSRANAWKRELSEREIADVERVAFSLMKDLGYEISGARVPVWVRVVRWGRKQLISVGRGLKQYLRSVG